jgi:hypothetical protein
MDLGAFAMFITDVRRHANADLRALSVTLEELHRTFVLLCGRPRAEGSKIPSPASLRIGFSGIQAVLAGMELSNQCVFSRVRSSTIV